MPVEGHAVIYVFVDERHLDEVAPTDTQLGTGSFAVERPCLDGLAGTEPYPGLLSREGKPAIRRFFAGAGQLGHAHRRPVVGVVGVIPVADLLSAAVVHVLVGHHAEPIRQRARLHRIGEPGGEADEDHEREGARPQETGAKPRRGKNPGLTHLPEASPLPDPQRGG
jgi:hypothetical protein